MFVQYKMVTMFFGCVVTATDVTLDGYLLAVAHTVFALKYFPTSPQLNRFTEHI